MKTIFMSLVSVLFAATAFAMPAVGDLALYNVTVSQGGQTISGTVETTITATNAGMFTMQTTMNFNGQSQVKSEQRSAQDLLSDSTIQQIIAQCAQVGGKIESVTVPAGTFNTCAVPSQEHGTTGTMWVAQVPFGLVKIDQTNAQGQKTYGELQSFKMGH